MDRNWSLSNLRCLPNFFTQFHFSRSSSFCIIVHQMWNTSCFLPVQIRIRWIYKKCNWPFRTSQMHFVRNCKRFPMHSYAFLRSYFLQCKVIMVSANGFIVIQSCVAKWSKGFASIKMWLIVEASVGLCHIRCPTLRKRQSLM